jgi:hypothetical protein
LGPREWDEGYELLYQGDTTWKRLVSFGFYLQPWQTMRYTEYRSIGRFEGEEFDPTKWKPRVPTAALLNERADDDFWAARRVMAFSDAMIRAIAKTGQYTDRAAESHLADVLIERRDKIGRAYLSAINPIVDPVLNSGILTFSNAAVQARVSPEPKGGYRAEWFVFNNTTGESNPLGVSATSSGLRIEAPGLLPSGVGSFVRIDVSAVDPPYPSWAVPVHLYFKRTMDGWKLVGLERLPEGE